MANPLFFFFGLLRDPDILETVIGRSITHLLMKPAGLPGFRLYRMRNESFPLLVEESGAIVTGVAVEGLSPLDRERIVFFESVEYDLRPMTIRLIEGNQTEARVFKGNERSDHLPESWSFETWQETSKTQDLREARLWMSLFSLLPLPEADAFWDTAIDSGQDLEQAICELKAKFESGR